VSMYVLQTSQKSFVAVAEFHRHLNKRKNAVESLVSSVPDDVVLGIVLALAGGHRAPECLALLSTRFGFDDSCGYVCREI